MASQLIENTFQNVYKDDFKDSDNYHRILFNGGRAVQARELTQLQTILSKEIERFGRNIFKEGASVNPISNLMIDNRYPFVKLESEIEITDDLIGVEYQGQTSGVKAKIIGYINAEDGDPITIYVQYTSGSDPTLETDTPFSTFVAGEELQASGEYSLTVQSINTTIDPALGYGTKASVGSGEFFVQGHFVYAEPQTIIVSKYTTNPDAVIGFKVSESIITPLDDNKLYDNQGDVPNLTAPGADRYRIKLDLVDRNTLEETDTFVFAGNVVGGNVVQLNNGRGDYNRILDVMAERTYEESGNYAVTPFVSTFEADSDTGWLRLNIADGLGYVRGYRADPGQTYIRVQKPTTTTIFNNEAVAANYGNFVNVDRLNFKGIFDVSTYELINLRDSVGYRGTTIGTARVRSIDEDSDFRIHLFDVKLNATKNFRSVKSIGVDSSEYGNIKLEAGVAVLKEVNNNNAFFSLPRYRSQGIGNDYSYTIQRYKATPAVSSGTTTITTGTGEVWANTADWLVRNSTTGVNVAYSASGGGTNSVTLTVDGSLNGTVLEVLGYVQKGSVVGAPYKTKVLTETTVTGTVLTDSSGNKYVTLNKSDIWNVLSIKLVDSNGADVSGRFYLDNGQRDNSYQLGKLMLTPGQTAPGGNVFSRFQYFSHNGNGDFFAVNSYSGQIAYSEIPSYKQQDGTVIELRDVLDFRPTVDTTGNAFTGAGGKISEFPLNTNLITLDTTYYLPRKDKLVLEDNGFLKYLSGAPALDPQFPLVQDNAMELYQFTLNPNTLNEKDLKSRYIDNRRYTMRDIGKLHQKILKVEEMATLSLLDIQAATLEVLDGDGLNRTKAGFLTDDFRDHRAANVDNLEYRASIDPSAGILRPGYREKNVSLVFDSDDGLTANTVLVGDEIMLNYSEVLYTEQSQVSGTVNVNPYTLINYQGTIILSPSSDEHRDVTTLSIRVDGRDEMTLEAFFNQVLGSQDTRTILDTLRNNPEFRGRTEFVRSRISLAAAQNFVASGTLQQALTTLPPATSQILASVFDTIQPTWKEYLWGWAGIDGRQTEEQLVNGGIGATNRNTFGRFASRLFIPRMRAREVRFRAYGLLPNTRHWPFFDGIRVDEYVVQLENLPGGIYDWGPITNGGWRFGRRGRRWRNRTTRRWWNWPGFNGPLFSRNSAWPWHPFWHQQNPGVIPTPWESRLITDAYGVIQGSFFIPNNDSLFFYAGTKRFSLFDITVEDVENSTSRAWTDYTVEGVNIVRIRPLRPPPPTVNRHDPIAQTFTVDNPEGMFVTKIRAYFKTKAGTGGQPVECEIRPVVNGYPSSLETVKDALKQLQPEEVSISENAATGTDFIFDNPIYLNGNTEYAIILRSPGTDYNAYISRVGDFILGTTEKKVTKQPTLGSLFKSQNGRTWEPSQWEDLKFRIYRADFVTSGTAVFTNDNYPAKLLVPNPFLITQGDSDVRVIHPNHGLSVGDTITFSGVDSDSFSVENFKVNKLLGTKTLTKVDGSGYLFTIDSAPSASVRAGGYGVYTADNVLMDEMYLSTEIESPPGTSVTTTGRFTTAPSFLGLATGGANAYDSESGYIHSLTPFQPYVFDAPRIILSEELELLSAYNEQSAEIKFDLNTSSSWVSPIISADRASITAIANIIDNQDSASTSGYNVPITWISETNPSEGSAIAKYVTKPVTLEEDAVGLKVLIAANKPSGTDYKVYYKLLTSNDQLLSKEWVLIEPENAVQNDDNPNIFREQRYLVGGLFGIAPFSTFQIKIIMTSINTSKVPKFKDFRAIALTV